MNVPGRTAGRLVTAAAAAILGLAAGAADAEVNVNLNIGAPAVVVSQPPEMIAIPQTMVYYAPGVSVELLFHGGYWWTVSGGHWYRSSAYRGPWATVHRPPAAIVHLPPNYRTVYVREKHVPYGQLKKHYRLREVDYRGGRGEFKGRGGHHVDRHDGRGKHKDHHEGQHAQGKGKRHGRGD